MEVVTNLEQYLAIALVAHEVTKQELLLTELKMLQYKLDGFETWKQNWEKPMVEPYKYHANAAKYGLDIGHPVTWPKVDSPYQLKVGPKPRDPVYYLSGVVVVMKTESEFGFRLATLSPYFLV